MIRLFFVALFVIAKDWKEYKCPSIREFSETLKIKESDFYLVMWHDFQVTLLRNLLRDKIAVDKHLICSP